MQAVTIVPGCSFFAPCSERRVASRAAVTSQTVGACQNTQPPDGLGACGREKLHASVRAVAKRRRRCGEMADAQDLKSWDRKKSCGFESHHRHHRERSKPQAPSPLAAHSIRFTSMPHPLKNLSCRRRVWFLPLHGSGCAVTGEFWRQIPTQLHRLAHRSS